MEPTPCPICLAPYGFHEEEIHAKIIIDPKLTRRSNTEIRRQRKLDAKASI